MPEIVVLPLLFVVLSILLVFIRSRIGANISGWVRLAEHYHTHEIPQGKCYHRQTARFGFELMCGELNVHLSESGLCLSVFPLFRWGHPSLIIPWAEVRVMGKSWVYNGPGYKLMLGNPRITEVVLSNKIVEEAQRQGFLPLNDN